MPDITRMLDAAADGDPQAAADLLPLVYDELRKLAAARLADEAPGQTLQATELVHEVYVQLDWTGPCRGGPANREPPSPPATVADVERRQRTRTRHASRASCHGASRTNASATSTK